MSDPTDFSASDLQTLRQHGIALFEDRVIFDAQPPIDADALARIAEKCAGPIPDQLLELWSMTAGGSLDYDVDLLALDGGLHSFSWTELFFNGATTYFDLAGWVNRELESLEEHCEETNTPFPGVLSWLPIGGFEYLDRVYVCVEPGEHYGAVAFWMRGLPPAWTHRLHNDSMAIAAPTLREALQLLHLRVDPRENTADFYAGRTLFQYIETRIAEHGMDPGLATELKTFYAKPVLDWRSLLDAGLMRYSPTNLSAAVDEAVRNDDPEIIAKLTEMGEDFRSPLAGTAVAVDIALANGAENVLRALLRVRAHVPHAALHGIGTPLSVDIVEMLVSHGARPTYEAAAQLVALGSRESGRVVARACPGFRKSRKADKLAEATTALAQSLRSDLARVRDATLFHHLGEEGLMLRIERLDAFAADPQL